jgi:hypothetical protein
MKGKIVKRPIYSHIRGFEETDTKRLFKATFGHVKWYNWIFNWNFGKQTRDWIKSCWIDDGLEPEQANQLMSLLQIDRNTFLLQTGQFDKSVDDNKDYIYFEQ